MTKKLNRTAAAALLGSLTLFACTERDQGPLGNDLAANDWLLSAENETERFERLQKQMRGFDQPMWEVGERYGSLEQRKPDAAWQAFDIARSACMSCHQAEKVEYMNNQALFELPMPADQRESGE